MAKWEVANGKISVPLLQAGIVNHKILSFSENYKELSISFIFNRAKTMLMKRDLRLSHWNKLILNNQPPVPES